MTHLVEILFLRIRYHPDDGQITGRNMLVKLSQWKCMCWSLINFYIQLIHGIWGILRYLGCFHVQKTELERRLKSQRQETQNFLRLMAKKKKPQKL
jgi:hypothetical protein